MKKFPSHLPKTDTARRMCIVIRDLRQSLFDLFFRPSFLFQTSEGWVPSRHSSRSWSTERRWSRTGLFRTGSDSRPTASKDTTRSGVTGGGPSWRCKVRGTMVACLHILSFCCFDFIVFWGKSGTSWWFPACWTFLRMQLKVHPEGWNFTENEVVYWRRIQYPCFHS